MAFPTPQEFKVVVVGEKSVGKTSLVLRFIDGCFQPQQQPTIGAFFFSKHLVLAGGAACVLQVWDTAGQERFRAITPMYYRQAMGAIVCFDVTSEASFETMQGWVKELRENTEPGSIVIAIAATKADLEAARVVDQEGPRLYAASIGALYAETSAKANVGVQDLFVTLGQRMLEKQLQKQRMETLMQDQDERRRRSQDRGSVGLVSLDEERGKLRSGRQFILDECC